MKTRINDVLSSLETGHDDVRMIGIKGIGGGGKTTLARAVFDLISFQYEGISFIENVREVSKASLSGLKSLQNQILSDVLNDRGIFLSSVYDGRNMMKRRMPCKKVLLVLDDIDDIEQLELLAGETSWFKPGSRIIITTRDEHVLVAHRVNSIHNVQLLLEEEAIYLLCRYAFGRVTPNIGYEELSQQVVHYAAGLPLTIKVLGSFLCGKDELEWIDGLERLKTIPLMETLKKLEISYITLEEDYKEMFLNVACIMKGWSKALAIRVLESCGFHARNGLRVLEQKSLITVDSNEYLGMHAHIEEMGRNIVRRSHPDKPCKHSRLWVHKEIEDILANDLGTEATRYIQFYTQKLSPNIVMKGLRKMKELRFLNVSMGYVDASKSDCSNRNFHKISNALRYLCWNDYPFKSLPESFKANNLVSLELPNSRIVQLWEGGERKVLNKLRFLDLSYSLLRTLDLGLTPNIETLNLKGCGELVELQMHAVCLKLIIADMSCSVLRTVDLGLAPNIELLDLERCSDLVELYMPRRSPNLRSLKLSNSKLRTLDIGLTPNLKYLDLTYCYSLEELHMAEECQKLSSLNISHSKLRNLDLGLTPNLEKLDLKNCYDLEELGMAGECRKLTFLNISRSKLRNLDLGLTPNLETLDLEHCYDLEELHMADECLRKLVYFELSSCLRFRYFVLRIKDDESSNGDYDSNCSEVEAFCSDDDAFCSDGDVSIREDVASSCSEGDASCSEDESLEVAHFAELHLTVYSLDGCPFHPGNNLPKFQFSCIYTEDKPLLTRNIEKLISVGLCACTNLETFSGSICGLEHLRKLTLKGSITEAPKNLDQLECLEELDLLDTKIKLLPDSICMLKHLKSLKIRSCWLLEKLPEDVGRLAGLEELILSSTKIKDLPDSICMLRHLESLELDDCLLLENLPDDLGRLECLKKLSLTSTKIKDVPNSICMLKHLESLQLCCSSLETLPEDLGRLECLEDLSLSFCKLLRDIPDSICKMKCLKNLCLYQCIQLEKLPGDLGLLNFLKWLSLEGTCITHLPQSIFSLKGLRIYGSRGLLQSHGFGSDILQTTEVEEFCYVNV